MAKSIEFRKLSRKKFLQELQAFGAEQRSMIEASVGGFAIDPAASTRRREHSRYDYRMFCETYFPHFIDTDVEPSLFQAEAYKIPLEMQQRPGARVPVAAPRGEGKSTLLIQMHAIWRIVHALSHYMPLIMDAREQAEMMLEAIKAELEVNPRLRTDFPEACGAGKVWNVSKMISANNIMIETFGAGKKIRGRRYGAWRPDFIFIDDFENDENVKSKEWRDKRQSWLMKVVANLGPPDGSMRQMYVGTVLHIDSVLVRTMKNPRWKAHARVFPSIHTWPDQMDLWDRWEEIFVNDSEDAADAFYRLNQREMDFGAVVSWPGKRPLVELMKLRAEDHHAFETEHQHNPIEPDGHPFAGVIQYWVSLPRDWAFYGAHDPSMGKAARTRDPSASLVGAKDRKSGKLCIADAIVARRVPDKQVSDLIKLQREYQCLVWAFESIAFQEFFRQHVVKESAAKGVPIPARAVISKVDKDLRIESMQPHVSNGLILFNRNHKTLLAQLEYWPDSDHDDGPDALEMLWQISLSGASSGASGLRAGKRQSSDVLKGYIDG